MKLIGNLLLTICLITGCLSAATAYLIPTSDQNLAGMTINENAGEVELADDARAELRAEYETGDLTAEDFVSELGHPLPLVAEGTELDDANVERLRSENVSYVQTKSFDAGRWPHAWIFGLSAAGLLAGSLLVRAGDKAAIAQQQPAEGAATASSPEAALKAISEELVALKAELPSMPSDDARLKAVINRLGDLQGDAIPTFIESRPQLIARFGLGKYAEIMDRFAAMERKVNRAWSAAADGHWPESSLALDDAVAIAPEVSEKL